MYHRARLPNDMYVCALVNTLGINGVCWLCVLSVASLRIMVHRSTPGRRAPPISRRHRATIKRINTSWLMMDHRFWRAGYFNRKCVHLHVLHSHVTEQFPCSNQSLRTCCSSTNASPCLWRAFVRELQLTGFCIDPAGLHHQTNLCCKLVTPG